MWKCVEQKIKEYGDHDKSIQEIRNVVHENCDNSDGDEEEPDISYNKTMIVKRHPDFPDPVNLTYSVIAAARTIYNKSKSESISLLLFGANAFCKERANRRL